MLDPALEKSGALITGSKGTTMLPTRSGRPARPPWLLQVTGGSGDNGTSPRGRVQCLVMLATWVVPFVSGMGLMAICRNLWGITVPDAEVKDVVKRDELGSAMWPRTFSQVSSAMSWRNPYCGTTLRTAE